MGWFSKRRLRKAVERLLASEPTEDDLLEMMIILGGNEVLRRRVWEFIEARGFKTENLILLGDSQCDLRPEIWEILLGRQLSSDNLFHCLRWGSAIANEAATRFLASTPTDDLLALVVEQRLTGAVQAAGRLLQRGTREYLVTIIRGVSGLARVEAWQSLLNNQPTTLELRSIANGVPELKESACRLLLEATESFDDIRYVLGSAPALFDQALEKIRLMDLANGELHQLFRVHPCRALWDMLITKGPTLVQLVDIAANKDEYAAVAWTLLQNGWPEHTLDDVQLTCIFAQAPHEVATHAWNVFLDCNPSDASLHDVIRFCASSGFPPHVRGYARQAARLLISRTDDMWVLQDVERRLPELRANILLRRLNLEDEPRLQALGEIRRLLNR